MADKTHYSCVFARWTDHVLLVRKSHPEWQEGRLNGVGGQVEEGETPLDAAKREFEEETSLGPPSDLREFCTLEDSQVIVHFYSGSLPDEAAVVSMMPNENDIGEELGFYDIGHHDWFDSSDVIDNLSWLVPMAFADMYHIHAQVEAYRREREGTDSPWHPVV